MILVISQPRDGYVFIEYAPSVERAKQRTEALRRTSPVKLTAHLIPGSRKTLKELQEALKPYKARGNWYRLKRARPVVNLVAAARRDRNFDTRGWARKQIEKRNPPAPKTLPPEPEHITRYWASKGWPTAPWERQDADKALDEAADEA